MLSGKEKTSPALQWELSGRNPPQCVRNAVSWLLPASWESFWLMRLTTGGRDFVPAVVSAFVHVKFRVAARGWVSPCKQQAAPGRGRCQERQCLFILSSQGRALSVVFLPFPFVLQDFSHQTGTASNQYSNLATASALCSFFKCAWLSQGEWSQMFVLWTSGAWCQALTKGAWDWAAQPTARCCSGCACAVHTPYMCTSTCVCTTPQVPGEPCS